MKAVITGANSFIGRHLIKEMNACGHECIAVVRDRRSLNTFSKLISEIIELDMCDYSSLGAIAEDADCLINLAWLGTRGQDRMDSFIQSRSYEYTLDAIRSFKDSKCKWIVTAGSQAEYGNISGYIREDTPLKPITEYGRYKAKLFSDTYDFCASCKMTIIEPRFFSLYGPGDYEHSMIMEIISKMIMDEDCELTEGIQMWDYLYIKDAVEGMVSLLSNNSEAGAYNFASGDSRMLKDYIYEMKTVLESRSILKFGAVPYPKTGMVSIMSDISKLLSTGWSPKVSFESGIRMTRNSI